MKTITIQVPDGVFKWLSANARRRKQTAAEIARETLAAAAKSNGPVAEGPSCFDLMKPAWRSIKNGPKDLSQREGFDE